PAYGPQNDVTLKMPAFEWVHVQLHQQKGMISLSPPTICNSAVFVNISDVPVNPRDYCQPLHPGCLGLVESGLGLVESGLMLVKQWFKVVQGWLKLVEKG
ncbi:hypothetical protein, partial [Escherichia coli]